MDSVRREIMLFVNPASGGTDADLLVAAGLEEMSLRNPAVRINLFNIREGPSGSKPGFQMLAERVKERDHDHMIFVIACGGDGTVKWCAEEMWKHEVDTTKVAVGVLPYGTGNDFARALAWNRYEATNPYSRSMKTLRLLCHEWVRGRVIWHDVWKINVELHPHGRFLHVDSALRKKVPNTDGAGEPTTSKVLLMNNYFSFGVESRVGIGFDRKRVKSSSGNIMIYATEGFKKKLRFNADVEDYLDEVKDGDKLICSTDGPHRKLKSCQSFICLNIPSFMGGLDVWGACHGKKVAMAYEPREEDDVRELQRTKQLMGDGRLEMLTFSGLTSLGAEKVIKGFGRRVHQGEGPFEFTFKDYGDKRVYFQVDGEYFVMYYPLKIVVTHYKKMMVLAHSLSLSSDRYTVVEEQPRMGL